MNVSLVVPAPQEGADRIRNWTWLRDRYVADFPDWELVEGATTVEPYSKGHHLNAAAAQASGDVLVLADADVLVAPSTLRNALTALAGGAAWVVPYERVYRLHDAATRLVLVGHWPAVPHPLRDLHLERSARRGPAGGGIVILRAEDFREVGGMDPRFTVWGGDDEAFGRALDTLVGPHVRLNVPAWHLWHPTLRPANGRGSAENERRAAQYLNASGDPDAMAALCLRSVLA